TVDGPRTGQLSGESQLPELYVIEEVRFVARSILVCHDVSCLSRASCLSWDPASAGLVHLTNPPKGGSHASTLLPSSVRQRELANERFVPRVGTERTEPGFHTQVDDRRIPMLERLRQEPKRSIAVAERGVGERPMVRRDVTL